MLVWHRIKKWLAEPSINTTHVLVGETVYIPAGVYRTTILSQGAGIRLRVESISKGHGIEIGETEPFDIRDNSFECMA